MQLCLKGHTYRYEMENICRLFLPHEPITLTDSLTAGEELCVLAALAPQGGEQTASCRVQLGGFDERREAVVRADALSAMWGKPDELTLASLLYELLSTLFGGGQPWGLITGVRPVKLLRRLTREYGEATANACFRERLLCSEPKLALAQRTLHAEDALLALSRPESCSVYISVPFCPTRCAYCSFVSQTTERSRHLIPAYVELLTREIAQTGALTRRLGLRVETVYIGGGTPTTLTAEQLEAVMAAVAASFDLSHLREYTVEAGRPDTVTQAKLRAIMAGGATRLSINPQTLHDSVLQAIGRRHTAAQFYEAYALARRIGFSCINTDLIAGLPTDTADGFAQTLSGILKLEPENVTVHTLSMKRASHLVIRDRGQYDGGGDTAAMVADSVARLPQRGYHPYYLYRQSRCVGNQENVGWAKAGQDGLYNVYIMDETHTILGCGAGAVSKLKDPDSGYLERIFNYKFPYEYNTRFEEILRRKEQVVSFYERVHRAGNGQ